jgi:hypothetical protein
MRHKGRCPKCNRLWREVVYSNHHVMPIRFFHNSFILISLCVECHRELETRIPLKQRMPIGFYFDVVNNFLGFKAVSPPERPC